MKVLKSIIIVTVFLSSFSCVQETHLKTVTFKVDMRSVVNPENVGLRGDFTENSWKETLLLKDDNNDGVYEGTFSQKTATNQIEFKFVNQNSNFELRGADNRIIQFEYKPETIIYEAVFNHSTENIIRK